MLTTVKCHVKEHARPLNLESLTFVGQTSHGGPGARPKLVLLWREVICRALCKSTGNDSVL